MSRWRHQIETYSALLAFCVGNRWIPHTKSSDGELWCFLCWVNSGEDSDLRRHRPHHDVTVMLAHQCTGPFLKLILSHVAGYLPIFFWFASLALRQSYYCHNASEVNLQDMSEIHGQEAITKHDKAWTVCMISWMYSIGLPGNIIHSIKCEILAFVWDRHEAIEYHDIYE